MRIIINHGQSHYTGNLFFELIDVEVNVEIYNFFDVDI